LFSFEENTLFPLSLLKVITTSPKRRCLMNSFLTPPLEIPLLLLYQRALCRDTTIPEEIHDTAKLPPPKRGGQQQYIVAKTSPKSTRGRNNNSGSSSQQTRGLLSHSSDSENSDVDVSEKLMKQQKPKKHFSVGSDDEDDEDGLTMKRS
jgi:hypothetical protein